MNQLKIVPARGKFNILRQICNFIPEQMVSKVARTTGAEDKSRTFRPWSHVVSLIYAQLSHSIGLNDLCDSLQLHSLMAKDYRPARREWMLVSHSRQVNSA